ncbi:MAG: TIGR03643 family protein [bacterium]
MTNIDSLSESTLNDIIAMAWCDKTPFERIQTFTGLSEKEVIAVMRRQLKPSSFRMWRKRVVRKQQKHEKKFSQKY